jgi:hypothetical protein
MNRTQSIATRIIALVFAVGATASTSAYALPHLGLHRHPDAAKASDPRVIVQIRNDAPIFKDIKIDGHVYTVLSHQFLSIKAPQGTDVYADSTGLNYRRGDLLFQVNPEMKDAIVALK